MLVQALAVAAAFVVSAVAATTASSHQITSLPNYNDAKPINFDQYAGHIPLPSNGQKMFYWLVESESNPSTDPLSDLSVKRNPYAWNRKANMVFLESPAGVGFSQPVLNDTDYNDNFTTDRAYEFLEQFLELYPRYKNREFYITGESYAGIYIPFLVHKLVTSPIANLSLTGFTIGNPFTDNVIDASAYMDYFYSHGMISIEAYNLGRQVCGDIGVANCFYGTGECNSDCKSALEAGFSMSEWGNSNALSQYYIYGDVCKLQSNNQSKTLIPNKNIRPLTHRGLVGPCQDVYTASYLQLPTVQAAIHVISDVIEWTACSSATVSHHYTRSESALDKYPTILQAGLKGLIYSGDADSSVNFIGTQRWLTDEGLNLTVVEKWQAWFGPDKQLAGYTVRYTNLTFKTVKGAGHMVPAHRPLHALHLFECFLYGNRQCQSFKYPKDALEYLSGADMGATTTAVVDSSANVWWMIGSLAALVGVALLGWRGYVHHFTQSSSYTELESKPISSSK
ncbi:hypothetical protein H257_09842 [Aphanomyces astaci]|uniref:Carboxypeptidase n=1 Tax=Aphanomyces astaci TaxID=112090 RepID=W4G836_APHAT|nr:hypothetical protein H257_09842 [Aphanomyces astaci]ETV75872.1 hypothetical protein H257_09842 [Aphanomyces astaci]|eukprot:XP_009834514.1 hypothetical protein H257_09842 [Aphanomyces astaci]